MKLPISGTGNLLEKFAQAFFSLDRHLVPIVYFKLDNLFPNQTIKTVSYGSYTHPLIVG